MTSVSHRARAGVLSIRIAVRRRMLPNMSTLSPSREVKQTATRHRGGQRSKGS